jgi:hypothetical protein
MDSRLTKIYHCWRKSSLQLQPTFQQPWEESTTDMQESLLSQQSTFSNDGKNHFLQSIPPRYLPRRPHSKRGSRNTCNGRSSGQRTDCPIQIFAGVEQTLKDIILEALNHDYLLEIEDDTLGFLNQTPRSNINHLRSRGGALDFTDTKTLLAERDAEWDTSEVPQIFLTELKRQ